MVSTRRAYFLVKDPHWTFLWWSLPTDAAESLDPYEPLYVRVHDVTDILFDGRNSHWCFDFPVGRETDHWYLCLPVSNRGYCAEIGLKTQDVFIPLVRSNAVFLPPDAPSNRSDESWVKR